MSDGKSRVPAAALALLGPVVFWGPVLGGCGATSGAPTSTQSNDGRTTVPPFALPAASAPADTVDAETDGGDAGPEGSAAFTCQLDETVPCSGAAPLGFRCAAAGDPTYADPTLACNAPVLSGASITFCCAESNALATSCGENAGLTCSYGLAYTCGTGESPTDIDPGLICSSGVNDPSGGVDYCCATSVCFQDFTITCPDPGTYGYTCIAGDQPTAVDPSLTCSVPVSNGDTDEFCCQ